MFTLATHAVHAPAVTLPEAAMLPALPRCPAAPVDGGGRPVDNKKTPPPKDGSAPIPICTRAFHQRNRPSRIAKRVKG